LFAAPIYPFISEDLANAKVPDDAPPLFICAASDDQLKLATHSSNLYSKWHMAGKQAELHMYAKGGHGFGMRKQNLPSDKWVERFYEWLRMQKYIK
jgi:acetyl esterase/lipase